MKHITVITLIDVRNYGSALQALATQEVFERLRCKVDFINYVREVHVSIKRTIDRWTEGFNPLKRMAYTIALTPSLLRQDLVFKKFLRKHIYLQKEPYTTPEDFKHFPIDADIYCTGSDQTWNSGWNKGIIGALFLDFVPDNVKKISYAASFGKDELDDWEREETGRLLKRYAAISVRESSGVDICNELGISGAVHVLDPTLQLDKDFWLKLVGKRMIKEPYLLVYQLNTNPAFDYYAKEFARRKGLRLVRFCWRYDQIVRSGKPIMIPPVEDFVSAIHYADYVITDSFHATAFSINLNTDFISIYPHEYGGRIDSILRLTHLERRHLKSYDDFSLVNEKPIDFCKARKILKKEREKGWAFLRDAIK